jgi:4-amino-4-deoxy-L-arabinose transferase-like glycosyltransferase
MIRALRRVPRAAWVCALLATLSAACWSVITPPFQAPDEPSHVAYIQLLAETGRLPTSDKDDFSHEQLAVLNGVDQVAIQWHPEVQTISSPTAQRELHEDLTAPLSRVGLGGAGVAAAEPPLYYALESIPYDLGSAGTLLDRLELMRLGSALLAGLAALFSFMFVREALPGAPWSWTVGGLGAALTPVLGFTSGVVTPDALLCAVAAALFYCLARAFRRELTRRLTVAIGALLAAGLLTKLNFVGLLPGALLGLLVLAFGAARARPGTHAGTYGFGLLAVAVAITTAAVSAYVLWNLLDDRPAWGIVAGALHAKHKPRLSLGELEYVWQFYLPRLPGMTDYFPGLSNMSRVWFDRTVGLYGWLDTSFPMWVYRLASAPAALLAVLGLRTLLARRTALRRRIWELAVYLAMSVGLMALVAVSAHEGAEGAGWAQPRYLLPLLPLAAAALTLAARGAGRRWGPVVGALIVVLFLAQDVFSQLQVVARFYG